MNREPWTFEDFESETDSVVNIYDPNLARHVAIFFDPKEGRRYLSWRNRQQARKRAEKAEGFFDDDGRC
jgi:hypothetical protein